MTADILLFSSTGAEMIYSLQIVANLSNIKSGCKSAFNFKTFNACRSFKKLGSKSGIEKADGLTDSVQCELRIDRKDAPTA